MAVVRDEAARLGPVIGFLAAVVVLANLYDDEGLFHAYGTRPAQWLRRPLRAVFVLASTVTAALRAWTSPWSC